jgi:hypothetical protein
VAPNMIALAKINNPGADFSILDCREMDKLNTKFDGILSGFCMPYLSKEDCFKFISDASKLLNADGVLYFSAIEGDYKRSGYETNSKGEDGIYVYYHETIYLQEALEKNNFENIDLVRKEYPGKDGLSTHIIFIAKKK